MKACIKCGAIERYKNGDCAPCARARTRRWNAENQERKAASDKAYAEANREKIADYKRAWVDANRERVYEKMAEWRAANLEQARATGRQRAARYRARHPLRVTMTNTMQHAKRQLEKNEALSREMWGE